MNSRLRPLFAAILVTLALVTLWRWQRLRQESRLERKEAWIGYLRGPLSDLLYGSSRLRPLLLKKRVTAAEAAEAQDAVKHLQTSANQAGSVAMLWQRDPDMAPLVAAAGWHQQIYDLLGPWKRLQGQPLGKEAVEVEADLRRQLWARVSAQRDLMMKEKALTKDEILEMNALLFSLKEETEGKR